METNENQAEVTPEDAAREAKVQALVDRGVEKFDADLGPIWPSRIDLDALDMTSSYNCIAAQLFGEYVEGVEALWPDAARRPMHYLRNYCCQLCHGDEAEYNASQAVKAAENAANPCHDDFARSHGLLGDDEAEIYYDDLQDAWTRTITRLRQERTSDGA